MIWSIMRFYIIKFEIQYFGGSGENTTELTLRVYREIVYLDKIF